MMSTVQKHSRPYLKIERRNLKQILYSFIDSFVNHIGVIFLHYCTTFPPFILLCGSIESAE